MPADHLVEIQNRSSICGGDVGRPMSSSYEVKPWIVLLCRSGSYYSAARRQGRCGRPVERLKRPHALPSKQLASTDFEGDVRGMLTRR